MSPSIEDRLKAAYTAKAEQVTDARLTARGSERAEHLAALLSDDGPVTHLDAGVLRPDFAGGLRSARQSRWIAPLLAAAVVTAVAAGALAVAGSHGQRRQLPAPPASHLSSPTHSATGSPTPTAGKTSPSSTTSPTGTGSVGAAAPPYLPIGKTGSRADVPWSLVGSGWRLVQPNTSDNSAPSLYLYDPAGGRYLITSQLPTQTFIAAWSPDGQRAMFNTYGDATRFRQLDLHTGQLGSGFTQQFSSFVSYTQPQGRGVLIRAQIQGKPLLLRYGADGGPQLTYPAQYTQVLGSVLYTADGTQLVSSAADQSNLLTNDGHLIRQYPRPSSSNRACQPVRWWGASTFLEACQRAGALGAISALFLQDLSGGLPRLLVAQPSKIGMGYLDARPLSNGDSLLTITSGCGSAGYDILHGDGSIAALTLPAGVTAPGSIVNLTGDLATFVTTTTGGCGAPGLRQYKLVDYDMVTGKTSTLLNSSGLVLGYPSPLS